MIGFATKWCSGAELQKQDRSKKRNKKENFVRRGQRSCTPFRRITELWWITIIDDDLCRLSTCWGLNFGLSQYLKNCVPASNTKNEVLPRRLF